MESSDKNLQENQTFTIKQGQAPSEFPLLSMSTVVMTSKQLKILPTKRKIVEPCHNLRRQSTLSRLPHSFSLRNVDHFDSYRAISHHRECQIPQALSLTKSPLSHDDSHRLTQKQT